MTADHSQPAPPPPALREHARERLCRLREQAVERGIDLPVPDALPGDVTRAWACSEFLAQACIANPALLHDLVESGDLAACYTPGRYAQRIAHVLAGVSDEADLAARLRRQRRREMVRIAWRDIGGLADLDETVRDTSAFADAAIAAAVTHLHEWAVQQTGTPRSAGGEEQTLVVVALGKLGAGELNFSSDIDLLFAYPEPGETAGGARRIDNDEYFTRLGRRLIRVLSDSGPDGFVFRVDMRLRPFGSTGPLVMSFDALEHYYQAHGRDWERYALVRARPVAGDPASGAALIERLRPFVYRRYLDFGALEALRDMKRMITEEVARKGLQDHVKLGPGGIREIEFTGQAFQMVRGGRVPALRDRRIGRVLGELGARGFLPAHAVDELCAAYRFLRTTENRLQQWRDQQTHLLPRDERGRARLAAGMGYAGWPEYARDLARHRARVTAQFEQVFGAADSNEPEGDRELALVWEGALDDAQADAALRRAGFREPAAIREELGKLRTTVRLLDKRVHQRLLRLLPQLLAMTASRRDSLLTVRRVLQVLGAVAKRSVYLALLTERPLVLSQLIKLCAASPLIARDVGRHPLLLDELLDPRTLYAPLSRGALQHELEQRMAGVADGDLEQEMEVLRQFKQANVLRVAAADVSRVMPLMVVSDHLTWIAEVVLERVLTLAWRDMLRRYGEPTHLPPAAPAPVTTPFAVIAYGKLGGFELGYGSDLDIVFVHGGEGDRQHTTGAREVDNAVYFGRLATRIIHFLGTLTPAGVLYEVDSRLRPGGASGLMVSGLDGLRRYLLEDAWTWEHQALVRARCVAGDAGLAERFAAIRREILLRERDPARLRAEVRDMRARMRRELGAGRADRFDLKQDAGGIADIEFVVQYGVLRWASRLGSYLDFTDNIRLLEGFANNRLMTSSDVALLADAYRIYRGRVHELALQEQPGVVSGDEFTELRNSVRRVWAALMEHDEPAA